MARQRDLDLIDRIGGSTSVAGFYHDRGRIWLVERVRLAKSEGDHAYGAADAVMSEVARRMPDRLMTFQ